MNQTQRSPAEVRAITLARPYNGIGDWLMALNCLLFVNRQRPDVAVHVDYAQSRRLPRLVPEAFSASNVRIAAAPAPRHAVATRDSLVYRKYPPVNYIESMLHHLNDQTGLDLRYERGVYPDFGVRRRPGDYLVMISQGKRRERHRKEWGSRNFIELARLLSVNGLEVRQIGAQWDTRIPNASEHLLGAHFLEVAELLAGARAFIGIENGLMILAGFLSVAQATIYDGHSIPARVDFAEQLKIADKVEPAAAAARILDWLRS